MEKIPVKFLIKNGFLHIFSANVINKIIQFCSGVVLVRFFTKEEYGQWSYAGNILSIFLLFEGLGVCSGLLQYASENAGDNERYGILKLSLKYGITFDVLLGLAVLVFSLIFTLPIKGAVEILGCMFLIPLFTLFFNVVESYLRATLRNFQFSVLTVMNTALFLIGSLSGALLYGVYGVVIGRYAAYIITDAAGFIIMKREFKAMAAVPLPSKNRRLEFFRYSVACMLSNSISGLLYLIDTFLVGLIIKDSSVVASYKTATLIPFALNFIPQSVIIFAYPYFAKAGKEPFKFKRYYISLVRYLGLGNILISTALFVLAPLLIKLVFGSGYEDAVLPFRILSVGYFFAGTFRISAGNILGAIRKVRANLYNAIVSGMLNIVLDVLFILWWGSVGAAISTTCIYIVSGSIANWCIYSYLKKTPD